MKGAGGCAWTAVFTFRALHFLGCACAVSLDKYRIGVRILWGGGGGGGWAGPRPGACAGAASPARIRHSGPRPTQWVLPFASRAREEKAAPELSAGRRNPAALAGNSMHRRLGNDHTALPRSPDTAHEQGEEKGREQLHGGVCERCEVREGRGNKERWRAGYWKPHARRREYRRRRRRAWHPKPCPPALPAAPSCLA